MNIIDLSHKINNDTPLYPGDRKTELIPYKTYDMDLYNAYEFLTGLHVGTHIDAPMHLLKEGKTMDEYPLEHFIGNGVLLDVRGEACIGMKPEYEEMVREGDIVLLYTGFSDYYNNEDKYFEEHPAVNEELTEFFLARNIKMLGMDMPAPDFVPFPVHKALLREGIFILENLTNLEALLLVPTFEIIAMPLKLEAEASLVRAAAKF